MRRREVKQHDALKHSPLRTLEKRSEPHCTSGGYFPGHPEIELAGQRCLEAKGGLQGHLLMPLFRGCEKVFQARADVGK